MSELPAPIAIGMEEVDFNTFEPRYGYTVDQLRDYGRAEYLRGLEQAAKVCDDYAVDKWNLYKGRPPYTGKEDGRADPHIQGESCGADDCVEAIRALKEST